MGVESARDGGRIPQVRKLEEGTDFLAKMLGLNLYFLLFLPITCVNLLKCVNEILVI